MPLPCLEYSSSARPENSPSETLPPPPPSPSPLMPLPSQPLRHARPRPHREERPDCAQRDQSAAQPLLATSSQCGVRRVDNRQRFPGEFPSLPTARRKRGRPSAQRRRAHGARSRRVAWTCGRLSAGLLVALPRLLVVGDAEITAASVFRAVSAVLGRWSWSCEDCLRWPGLGLPDESGSGRTAAALVERRPTALRFDRSAQDRSNVVAPITCAPRNRGRYRWGSGRQLEAAGGAEQHGPVWGMVGEGPQTAIGCVGSGA